MLDGALPMTMLWMWAVFVLLIVGGWLLLTSWCKNHLPPAPLPNYIRRLHQRMNELCAHHRTSQGTKEDHEQNPR